MVLAACAGGGDSSGTRAPVTDTPPRGVGRAEVVSAVVHVETLAVPAVGRRARGPEYERAIAAWILPHTSGRSGPFTVADTDVSNYQAASAWMHGNDTSSRGRNRFGVGHERYGSGVLILELDTLLERERQQPSFDFTGADSIAITGLAPSERVADECRLSGYEPDERIVGLLPTDTVGVWMRPRLAWFVDTLATRFRAMRPDSVACWLPPDRDR